MFLYTGHDQIDARQLFLDLRSLMLLEIQHLPPKMVSYSFIMLGTRNNAAGNPTYIVENLADGDYTLAATTYIEEPLLLNAERAPVVIEEFTIVNGEAIIFDLLF